MQIIITGEDLEYIGDQVAALDKLFRPTAQVQPFAPTVAQIGDAMSTASLTPPDPGSTGDVVELDVDGQPWNAEIHSGNHSRKKDGRWTLRRGVDRARVAAVYAEWTASQVQTLTPVSGALHIPTALPNDASGAAALPGTLPLPGDGTPLLPLTPPAAPPAPPPVPPPVAVGLADPLTACIQVATALMTRPGEDPVAKQAISLGISTVMGQSGLTDMTTLQANPQVAPTVLAGLRALAVQYGVPC